MDGCFCHVVLFRRRDAPTEARTVGTGRALELNQEALPDARTYDVPPDGRMALTEEYPPPDDCTFGLLFCGLLFIEHAAPSPWRLFSTGKYPFFFVKLSMHGPSTVFCLFVSTHLILSSDSLCCLNFPATLLSILLRSWTFVLL